MPQKKSCFEHKPEYFHAPFDRIPYNLRRRIRQQSGPLYTYTATLQIADTTAALCQTHFVGLIVLFLYFNNYLLAMDLVV